MECVDELEWSGGYMLRFFQNLDREGEKRGRWPLRDPVAPTATTMSSLADHLPLDRTDKLARPCDAG